MRICEENIFPPRLTPELEMAAAGKTTDCLLPFFEEALKCDNLFRAEFHANDTDDHEKNILMVL